MADINSEDNTKQYSLPIRRPVTMAMLFLTFLVFGWQSYQKLPINLMPDISYPTLTVRTEFEGAAPEDVEKLVTRPLEEQLAIVSGMVELTSTSSAGLSEIVMEFNWGTDMNVAQQDVRDRLDLFDPPREVTEKPVILRYDPTLDPVIRVAIRGVDLSHITDARERAAREREQLTAIREAAERYVKGDLESELGIAQVIVTGGRKQEIEVLVDSERVKNLGLSVEAIEQALAQQNINLSGGSLREGRTEYLVRTKNEWERIEEIPKAVISTLAGGQQIRLSDVATVRLGEKDRESIVHINGQEAVELQIYKWGDANTVRVCNTVKDLMGFEREKSSLERLTAWYKRVSQPPPDANVPSVILMQQLAAELKEGQSLRNRLPAGSQFSIISDQSRFIIAAIKEVQNAAVSGALLAIIVLYFFLREIRATVIMGVAIPISIVTTFIPMFMQGLTLNIMSLGGLAMGVGMLVDNSIVVMESIFRCREEGDDVKDAADRGLREVSAAVVASTLTTVAVFFPIAFVEGVAGQLFADHALTVTYSLLASLLVALYLNPMIASREKMKWIASEDVVWLLQCYRRGRLEDGLAPSGALAMLLPNAVVAAAEWLIEQAERNYGPLLRWIQEPFQSSRTVGIVAPAKGLWRILIAPPLFLGLTLLFTVHSALQLFMQIAVTVLFVGGAMLAGVFSAVGWLVGKALWLPLTLFNRGFHAFRESYGVFLRHSLRFSPAVLALVVLLAIHAASLVPGLGRELIPAMNQGEFGIRLEAPPGTRLEETERRARVIEQIALAMPEIATVAVEIGEEETKASDRRGENTAEFSLTLRNPKENVERQPEIMEALRASIAERISDTVVFTLPSLFSFKSAIELQIRGDEYRELKRVGEQLVAAIRDVPGIKDPKLNMRAGYPEVIIELDRDLLAAKNITPESVAMRLRAEVQGNLSTELNRPGEKIDVRVRTDRKTLSSVEDLRKLSVTDGYPPVPLEAVARIRVQEGPSEIVRIDQRQVALVTANVEGRSLGAVMSDIEIRKRDVEMPRDYVIVTGGQNRELEQSAKSLQFALLLAVFLVYAVMACQFESLLHPGLVMTTVPLALIGVIYALDFLSMNINILVYIGVISLSGIVVNNAIVLIDYVNQLIDRGMSRVDALVEAGKIRMRPIFMTTLTTVLGLLPMALATGEGDEIRRPMAITIIAGLTFSTVLTLVIIPMVYYLFGGRGAK